jgi:hypothetical protein
MTSLDQIGGKYHSNQAEHGDGGRQHIGDPPRAYIAIGDGEEDSNRDSYDYRLHCFTRSRGPIGLAGRPEDRLATRDLRRLGVGDYDVRTECGGNVLEKARKTVSERLGADSDSKGDEDNEHGVFRGRSAALVPIKAIDQPKHLPSPLECVVRRYGQCTRLGIATRHCRFNHVPINPLSSPSSENRPLKEI